MCISQIKFQCESAQSFSCISIERTVMKQLILFVSVLGTLLICATIPPALHVRAASTDCSVRGPGVDLSGCDLTGVDLTGVDLTGADLTSANLTGADLTSAILTNAALAGSTLTGIKLANATLTNVSSGGIIIIGIPSSIPLGWQIIGGYLIGPSANLSNADLKYARLNEISLVGTTLTNANFSNALFQDVTLTSVDLSTAILTGLSARGITGTPTQLPTNWQLINTYLIGPTVNLTGANLSNLNFSGG